MHGLINVDLKVIKLAVLQIFLNWIKVNPVLIRFVIVIGTRFHQFRMFS